MAGVKTPFVEKSVDCPFCHEASKQRFLRSRVYAVGERESDQHVLHYKWTAQDMKPAHPPHYFVMHCPRCGYADSSESFLKPDDNPFRAQVHKAIRKAESPLREVIEFLARHVEAQDEIDFHKALNLHLLAVLYQLIPEDDARDHYKIARLLLRIAWLYRENASEMPSTDELPLDNSSLLQGIDRLDQSLQAAQQAWAELNPVLQRHIEDHQRRHGDEQDHPYHALRKNLPLMIVKTRQLGESLRKTSIAEQAHSPRHEENPQAPPFFDFPSYDAFFAELKRRWPEAPRDEQAAMRMAIPFFEQATTRDPRLAEDSSHFAVIGLIADLMDRCGNLDGAYRMIGSLYKAAMDARNKHREELRDPDNDEAAKRQIKARIERAQSQISRTGELRQEYIEKLLRRERPRIDATLTKYEGHPPETIEAALEKIGIPPGVIQKLKDRGGPLAPRKKGLFG